MFNRAKAVRFLTANCDCWKGAEATLNGMTDEQLKGTALAASVERRVLAGYLAATGIDTVTTNQLNEFVSNAASRMKEVAEGNEPTKGEQEEETQKLRKKVRAKDTKTVTGNASDDEDDEPTNNSGGTAMTAEQFWAAAPDELKEVIVNAREIQAEKKAEIVARLTANCVADKKAAAVKAYNAMPLKTLKDLDAALPKATGRKARPTGNAAGSPWDLDFGSPDDGDDFAVNAGKTGGSGFVGNGEDEEDDDLFAFAGTANRSATYGPGANDRTGVGAGDDRDDVGLPLPTANYADLSEFNPDAARKNGRAK